MYSRRGAYGIHRAFRSFVPRAVAARVKRRGANPQSQSPIPMVPYRPADWYLPAVQSFTLFTEILRCCGDPAEGLQVGQSWSCVEWYWSNIVILTHVHPFATLWHFAPVGSVSLDSQSPLAPYESSSLATSRGNEKIRGAFLLSADRPRMTVEGGAPQSPIPTFY